MNKRKFIAGLIAPIAIAGLMFSTTALTSGFAVEPKLQTLLLDQLVHLLAQSHNALGD